MMKSFALNRHETSPALGLTSIKVGIERAGTKIILRYALEGDASGILLPSKVSSERTDSLWKHTCFEMFIRPEGQEGYLEFNFSPSTQWAAYSFDGYREGMKEYASVTPQITVGATGIEVVLEGDLPQGGWDFNLTAVIEGQNGEKAYWALAHPSGAPDFHHIDGFVGEL